MYQPRYADDFVVKALAEAELRLAKATARTQQRRREVAEIVGAPVSLSSDVKTAHRALPDPDRYRRAHESYTPRPIYAVDAPATPQLIWRLPPAMVDVYRALWRLNGATLMAISAEAAYGIPEPSEKQFATTRGNIGQMRIKLRSVGIIVPYADKLGVIGRPYFGQVL